MHPPQIVQETDKEQPGAVTQLTQAVIAGDRDALADLYHQYFHFIYHEAKRAGCHDESLRLDIIHEVMIRIMHTMKIPFQSETQLKNWLRRITYSVTYDHYRKNSARRIRDNTNHQTTIPHETNNNTISTTIDDHRIEQLNWLRNKIAELDDHQSTLIVMRYRFNWTLKKIADTLNLSTGAVDGRINRILSKLRKEKCEHSNE